MFNYLIRNRTVIPKYYIFQLIIRDVIKTYEDNLKKTLSSLITKEDEKKIEEILQLKDEKGYISKLAFIRTSAKGFNKSYVEEEIKKRIHLEKLFPRTKEIIQRLELSESTVQKYAKFIDAYQYSHIKQLENKDLYVLCFVYYRYLKSNDDMMRTFIYWINKYYNDVQRKIDETILKENIENNKLFPWVAKLIEFVYTKDSWKNLSHDVIWGKLTKFLDEKQAEKIRKYFEKSRGRHNDLRWFLYKELHGKIQSSARQFLRNVKMSYSDFLLRLEPDLVKFIEYYQSEIQKETPKIDWDNYPFNKKDKEEKFAEDSFKLKEIQLFNRINKYMKFGEIYLEDSIEFRHLELDLIPKSEFYKNKKEILSKINLPYIQEPLSKIIDERMKYLENMYHITNKNILEGKNTYFNIKGKDNWTLNNETQDEEEFVNFFENFEVELFDLLMFVNNETNFLNSFEHIAPINTKKDEDLVRLSGVLMAYGTNKGIGRIVKDLRGLYSWKQLKDTALTRFRPETLQKANELVINKTAKMPIFEHFNVDEMGAIHSSSDGQKFSVSVNTITARYSQKYFGKGKGLSVLTLTANFQPLVAKTISPNEFEGHYILELLLMNESEIQPEKHSTDNHGINEINFGMLDFFGFKFCPRYKTLTKKTHNLSGNFKLPENYILKPRTDKSNKIDIGAILAQEDEMKRVIVSIALKKSSAGTIVKKINSLNSNNYLKRAFVEFNKIISSTFMLEYINNEKFRTQIQIHLNRGEAFHRLKKAVFYADGGKMKGKSEHEQSVYQNSAMLLSSIIIYYNCRILSKLLLNKKISDEEREKVVKATPFVWNHVDIYGKYDFNIKKKDIKTIEKKLK